ERLAIAGHAFPVGVDHHRIPEDHSDHAQVLTETNHRPVFVSPELREREPIRYFQSVLVLRGNRDTSCQNEGHRNSETDQRASLHCRISLVGLAAHDDRYCSLPEIASSLCVLRGLRRRRPRACSCAHSSTSARPSRGSGIVMSSDLAIFALITSSSFVTLIVGEACCPSALRDHSAALAAARMKSRRLIQLPPPRRRRAHQVSPARILWRSSD